MRMFTLITFAMLMSCVSSKKYQTIDYNRLHQNHKKIAILPIIFEDKQYEEGLTESEIKTLLVKENDFVQNAMYQRLTKDSGPNKNDIKIRIEPISTTNQKLKSAGMDLLQLSNTTDETLAKTLDVDAILRIRINTAIMLHSTRYDLPKEILSNARVFIKDPILARTIDLDVVPVFMSAEIIDMKEFSPVWVYTKKRSLEVHDKNTDLLKYLCGDLVKQFPYR
ncbi:MAG: hypothetical protein IPO92_14450 [Saprospiraceae bacterium]|nr:hypothetical protein [Saprospiraceae bacterium]